MCCIWWLLFGFFIGLLLYWLLDKFLLRGDDQEQQRALAEKDRKITQLEQELAALHSQVETDKQASANAAQFGYSPQKNGQDNLQLVEGIGPKIESLLHAGGIHTFIDLQNASVDELKAILEQAGARFKLAKPETWPVQAEYCSKGDWQGLKDYQDYLQGGVDLSPRDKG